MAMPIEAGPDTVCRCGHWFEEHYLPQDGEPAGCEGCYVSSGPSDDAYQHGFEFDPEGNTFEDIANRGGDPEKWPDWMKADPRYQEIEDDGGVAGTFDRWTQAGINGGN